MRIVMVEWKDSRLLQGSWLCKEHIEYSTSKAVSLGVILKETDSAITMIASICEGDYAQGIVIPKSAIKRIRKLEVR